MVRMQEERPSELGSFGLSENHTDTLVKLHQVHPSLMFLFFVPFFTYSLWPV
jgi:hypothetical protein